MSVRPSVRPFCQWVSGFLGFAEKNQYFGDTVANDLLLGLSYYPLITSFRLMFRFFSLVHLKQRRGSLLRANKSCATVCNGLLRS